ncbi:hypothetical protein E5221_01115 [Pseudomonas sp. A2]|nr:hypothetical protein E5221_01115 [Pseudomonas sp. A2]
MPSIANKPAPTGYAPTSRHAQAGYHRCATGLKSGGVPVGAGLPAIGPQGLAVSFHPPPNARNTPICP